VNEKEVINRKIFLKRQASDLLRQEIAQLNFEIEDLRDRLSILRLKGRFEDKLKEHGFDSVLSRKIDCIHYLLEN